jgi:hypothetical protein
MLSADDENDEETDRHAYGKPEDVDDGEALVPAEIAQSDDDIIPKHHSSFGVEERIKEDGAFLFLLFVSQGF